MTRRLLLLFLLSLVFTGARADGDALPPDYQPLQRFPAGRVTVRSAGRSHEFRVWIARTPQHRSQGLMFVRTLDPDRGMLFVFPEAGVQCFWMKNTLIPLSIAFLDDSGRIVQIAEMLPQSLDNHCSLKPVRFALEMNAGWFKSRGLAAGAKINGLERAPAGR